MRVELEHRGEVKMEGPRHKTAAEAFQWWPGVAIPLCLVCVLLWACLNSTCALEWATRGQRY